MKDIHNSIQKYMDRPWHHFAEEVGFESFGLIRGAGYKVYLYNLFSWYEIFTWIILWVFILSLIWSLHAGFGLVISVTIIFMSIVFYQDQYQVFRGKTL